MRVTLRTLICCIGTVLNSSCDTGGFQRQDRGVRWFRYGSIGFSSSTLRASSAISFFLIEAISLLMARSSACAFFAAKCSAPSCVAM